MNSRINSRKWLKKSPKKKQWSLWNVIITFLKFKTVVTDKKWLPNTCCWKQAENRKVSARNLRGWRGILERGGEGREDCVAGQVRDYISESEIWVIILHSAKKINKVMCQHRGSLKNEKVPVYKKTEKIEESWVSKGWNLLPSFPLFHPPFSNMLHSRPIDIEWREDRMEGNGWLMGWNGDEVNREGSNVWTLNGRKRWTFFRNRC